MTQSFASYLQQMAKDGTYADHLCLQSLSDMLKINISIIHAGEEDVTISTPGSTGLLVLGFLPDLHHYVNLEKM